MSAPAGKSFRIASRSRRSAGHPEALLTENEQLREYYLANEVLRQVGLIYATDEQFSRFEAARTRLLQLPYLGDDK